MKSIKIPISFIIIAALIFLTGSCSEKENIAQQSDLDKAIEEYARLKANPAIIEFSVPEDNPGPPFYARIADMGLERLFLENETVVVIPMMRQVECIDPEFNLLDFFHVPNAFLCPLTVTGRGLIEPNSPPDRFPEVAFLESSKMPFWFVTKQALYTAIEDGVLTLSELEALNPKKGVASRYIEYNKPRTEEDHLLVIEADGRIPSSNENFEFRVASRNKRSQSAEIRIW
jgi:hypothetical protein